jgi:hypothetical protein
LDDIKYNPVSVVYWKLSWVLGRWFVRACASGYVLHIFSDKPLWDDEKMKGYLPWTRIKSKVSKTIRDMYKHGTGFVSSRHIAEKLYEEKYFSNVTYKATIDRVTIVLRDHMKWGVYSNGVKGRVYIVPEKWWRNAKAKSS